MDTPSWEQQPWDEPRYHQWLQGFLDMGPDRSIHSYHDLLVSRSVNGVSTDVQGQRVPSRSALQKWSLKFDWQQRAKDYDRHIGEVRQKQRMELAKEEWEVKLRTTREKHERIAAHMTDTALKGLEAVSRYLDDIENIEGAIEGQRGKGLVPLISALKQIAESGTTLDERSLGVDAMMIEYENGQKEE